jgi:hypothetical protein
MMTSPIGSSNVAFTSSLTSLGGNHDNKNDSTGSSAEKPASQPETLHPTPIGPLGHNINTTA